MQQRIRIMLEMQDAMNTRVHPEWRTQGFEWYRAIWVECAELLDHYGWKWWKKQDPDIEQIKLELVDIWHFGLSHLLLNNEGQTRLVEYLAAVLPAAACGKDFRVDLEEFALDTLSSHGFDTEKFAVLLADTDLGFDELYERYVGKNVLNFFRQDHGYQDGTYSKIWGGREDNEHLVELVAELDSTVQQFQDNLYAGLGERYRTLVD